MKDDGTKDCIIDKSAELLQKYGLKFSLDMLCAELKISKKTVYKYFFDKQALASAMFEKIYEGLYAQARSLADREKCFATACGAVRILQSALKFSDGAVFNRYSLNGKISAYATEKTEIIWEATKSVLLGCGFSAADNPCFKSVAFATLGKLDENQAEDFTRLISGDKL